MIFNWAMIPIALAGVALALAPWIAKLWVDAESRCPTCGRELLLSDPIRHHPRDVEFCRLLIERGRKG